MPIRLDHMLLPTKLIGMSRSHSKLSCNENCVNNAKTKVDKSTLPQLGIILRAGFTAKSVYYHS